MTEMEQSAGNGADQSASIDDSQGENASSPPDFSPGDDGRAETPGIADDVISVARKCIGRLQAEDAALPLSERSGSALEDFLQALESLCPNQETGPDRLRWMTSVRQCSHEFLETLRIAGQSKPDTIPAEVLMRAGAEAIRWDIVNRYVPDKSLWVWLGDLFAAAYGPEVLRVQGTGEDVAREYLRAVAYHAAALDQLSLKAGFAAAQLISVLLPDLYLLLVQEGIEGALYGIDVAQRGAPMRIANPASFTGWWFVTADAADKLSEIYRELASDRVPAGLETIGKKELRAAVLHLRRQWSSSPPLRRHQRHALNVRLSVVHGYEDAMNVLSDAAVEAVAAGTGSWRITDLSCSGVGATAPRNIMDSPPVAGDIVAFCPEEGTRWHIGVVRRVRAMGPYVEVGIATLSSSPELTCVDDGRAPRELCVCDPVRRGGVIRLVAPLGTLEGDIPLFATSGQSFVYKLRPVADVLRGGSFDLRVYQVT
ncbi:MAG: hypothetical protein LBG78_07455 [Azoarcus sp.]|jgi:hypothetical protein|nr:hypothetical protein [Azoarcus sp.]